MIIIHNTENVATKKKKKEKWVKGENIPYILPINTSLIFT